MSLPAVAEDEATASSAVRFHSIGGVDALQLDRVGVAEPAADEIRIRVRAFALNRADLMFVDGAHYTLPRLPSRIGSEAVGIVEAVGAGVTGLGVGDRVSTIPFHTTVHGVQGQHAVVPARYVRRTPERLSDTQGASIWMQYLTPYFALVEIGRMSESDTVLVTAGASSAGLGTIQLCRSLGVRVIATVRSPHKAELLRSLGAEVMLPGDGPQSEQIHRLTDGAGIRLSFDPIGGDSLTDYADALAQDAIVFGYGALSGANPVIPVAAMVRRNAVFRPYSMFNHVVRPAELERGVALISASLESGELSPIIDRVFEYDQTLEAYRYMLGNQQAGKIVVQLPG